MIDRLVERSSFTSLNRGETLANVIQSLSLLAKELNRVIQGVPAVSESPVGDQFLKKGVLVGG